MSRRYKNEISHMLYKPLKYTDEDGEDTIIIICSCTTSVNQNISIKGTPHTETVTSILLIDLTKTISTGTTVVDILTVVDFAKFKQSLQEISVHGHIEEIITACAIISSEISELSQRSQILTKAFGALKYASNINIKQDTASLIINNNRIKLANMVFKTVNGGVANLSDDDVNKVGNTIMNIIMDHVDMDINDTEQVKKLKAEIEYKIIEAIPNSMQANTININMDAILEEVKRFREKPPEKELE